MNNILGKILDAKSVEVEDLKIRVPEAALRQLPGYSAPVRPFAAALRGARPPAIIAELKKASPSAGLIRPDFSLEKLCAAYTSGGAAAISVLTEKNFFMGDLGNLAAARKLTPLPLLRKDFIFDEYQVHESRAAGADCILLIAAALDAARLKALDALAHEIKLETLIEAHDEEDIEKALQCRADVIGINNRNLKTLEVDIGTSVRLARLIPRNICKISESGIKTKEDARRLLDAGYEGFLVGESLVRADDPASKLMEIRGLQA